MPGATVHSIVSHRGGETPGENRHSNHRDTEAQRNQLRCENTSTLFGVSLFFLLCVSVSLWLESWDRRGLVICSETPRAPSCAVRGLGPRDQSGGGPSR